MSNIQPVKRPQLRRSWYVFLTWYEHNWPWQLFIEKFPRAADDVKTQLGSDFYRVLTERPDSFYKEITGSQMNALRQTKMNFLATEALTSQNTRAAPTNYEAYEPLTAGKTDEWVFLYEFICL